ncbi:MAG: SGNH/GDSL hydrolase family protein, partial [bacterium]|nr:SGNH/GDSL hydrolase family protein [bacterium]
GRHLGRGLAHQVINTAISGGRARGLVDQYEKEWVRWQPDMVVVNLAHNDTDPHSYRGALADLARINGEKGIPTLFVLEPNAPEQVRENLLPNHGILREVARDHGFPVLDLHSCLGNDPDSGILWWDFVHLTSYGQELAARCLLRELAPYL